MKIHLCSAYAQHPRLDHIRRLADLDDVRQHTTTGSPHVADAILFVENTHFNDYLFRTLREHFLVRRYPDKVFMYNESDKPTNVLPGLYCSMPSSHYERHNHIAFPYLLNNTNRHVPYIHEWQVDRRFLYSFVGSMSHRIRHRIASLAGRYGHIEDTSNYDVWNASEEEQAVEGKKFADAMASSLYVLCPRGIGTSSFRPFEAMRAARAPVIISDHWVPPPQVDWSFAVFVNESDIATIPDRLASIADEAIERGLAARRAWESVYADGKLFNTVADTVAELQARRQQMSHVQSRNYLREFAIQSEVVANRAARQLKANLRAADNWST